MIQPRVSTDLKENPWADKNLRNTNCRRPHHSLRPQAIVTCVMFAAAMLQTWAIAVAQERVSPQDTKPLTEQVDPADKLVGGIDRFLLQQIEDTAARRRTEWREAAASEDSYQDFLADRRSRLAESLGIRGDRVTSSALEYVATTQAPSQIAATDTFTVHRVRWPVLRDPTPGRNLTSVYGEGLLLQPTEKPMASVVAIPDADQTPEQICGLVPGFPPSAQYARRLAAAGCRVIVPAITSRRIAARNGRATMTDREFIYRSAFVLGEHVIGYEVQNIFAAIDALQSDEDRSPGPTGVFGYGEGGMLALLTSALEPRVEVTVVSGFFGPRENCWQEPLDRNVFGLLQNCGAAELAAMTAPGSVIVETASIPQFQFNGNGGAPATLLGPSPDAVGQEVAQANKLGARIEVIDPEDGEFGTPKTIETFLSRLFESPNIATRDQQLSVSVATTQLLEHETKRRQRQLQELDRHNQAVLRESPFVRAEFWKDADTSSVQSWEKSVEPYRTFFRDKIIGAFDEPSLPPNAHSRKLMQTDMWTAWEIRLDVFLDVGAYGVLLLPNDFKPGEQRPVVVCQHGLEGRPLDTIHKDHRAYHDYAAKLCEQGFITFAPQNIYIFKDRFRTLQRKANPLGKTLFSIMVPQHQQIINWLKSQPFVDGNRIAFYGLSYGGKSAMRIPALVTDYCLSICSADFNEWVTKNASTRHNFSYVWTGEYEIFYLDPNGARHALGSLAF